MHRSAQKVGTGGALAYKIKMLRFEKHVLTSVVGTTGGLKGLKVNSLSGGLGTGGWRGTLCTAPVVWPRILRYQRIEGQLFLKSELNIRYRRIEGTDGNIAIAV